VSFWTHSFHTPQPPKAPVIQRLGGWALYPLVNQSGCSTVCTSCPVRSAVAEGLLLPPTLSHICLGSAAGRVVRLHSSSSCVNSSDCRSRKWWERSWAAGSGGFDCALSLFSVHPDHPVRTLRPLPPYGGGEAGASNSVLCPCEVTSSQHTALLWDSACESLSRRLEWLGRLPSIYGICAGDRALLGSVSISPSWELASLWVLQVHWNYGLCPVPSMQCFSALPKSP
jgi:hypothetical protein